VEVVASRHRSSCEIEGLGAVAARRDGARNAAPAAATARGTPQPPSSHPAKCTTATRGVARPRSHAEAPSAFVPRALGGAARCAAPSHPAAQADDAACPHHPRRPARHPALAARLRSPAVPNCSTARWWCSRCRRLRVAAVVRLASNLDERPIGLRVGVRAPVAAPPATCCARGEPRPARAPAFGAPGAAGGGPGAGGARGRHVDGVRSACGATRLAGVPRRGWWRRPRRTARPTATRGPDATDAASCCCPASRSLRRGALARGGPAATPAVPGGDGLRVAPGAAA
jgi:hypothetical protein